VGAVEEVRAVGKVEEDRGAGKVGGRLAAVTASFRKAGGAKCVRRHPTGVIELSGAISRIPAVFARVPAQ
jgi:hypothetical protein